MDISSWHLVLLWIAIYSLVSVVASRTNRVPDYLTAQGPIMLIHTDRGRETIDSIAQRFPRFWSLWGVGGVVVFFGGLAVGTIMLLFSVFTVVNQPSSAEIAKEPQNLLVIPGFNDYLPLEAAPPLITALLIAMVIHELGHAIYCRMGDIDIKSTGIVLLALIPAGAFVEPDEESQEAAPRWARLQMVSAGVMNNLGATVVAMAVLVLLVPAVVSPAAGVAIGGVIPNSPVDESSVESGDRIVSVDGTNVQNPQEFTQVLGELEDSSITVTTGDGDTHTINRRVFVTGVHQDSAIELGQTIVRVNGETIRTTGQFDRVIQNADSPIVTLTNSDGEHFEHVVGARVRTSGESSLAEYTSDDGIITITAIDGQRVYDSNTLSTVLSDVSPGDTIVVEGVSSTSEQDSFEVQYTVPEDGASIAVTSGVGGISVSELGVQFFPAEDYLGYITADGVPVWSSLVLIIFLPFATVGGLPYNFTGFTPDVIGFYQVSESFEPIAPIIFFGVSLAFWTVWINVNLTLFNCLPTYALDGGHYMKYGLETIAAKLGSDNPKQASEKYVRAVAVTILVSIALIVTIPPLFG